MTSKIPIVSVVMPVYNAEKYLADTIRAILGQSFEDLELIIVDDGSTDRSAEIVHGFKDDRIRYQANERNMGVVETRNRGIQLSRGKYISLNDADDIPLPHKLKLQVNFMEENPEIGVCGTCYQLIDMEGKKGEKIDMPATPDDVDLMAKFMNPFCNSSTLTRSELMKKFRYDKQFEYAEDFRLWSLLLKEAKGANLPDYSLLYRVHGSNISIVNRDIMMNGARLLHQEALTSLGVSFTEEELTLHNNFLNCITDKFDSPGKLKEAENWLVKVYRSVGMKKPCLDKLSLKKLLFENWIAICFNTKSFRKLLFPELALISPGDYYPILLKKFVKKVL